MVHEPGPNAKAREHSAAKLRAPLAIADDIRQEILPPPTVWSVGPRYKYTSLNKDASEIKLITLLPGTFGTETHIKLETVELSDTYVPQYQALGAFLHLGSPGKSR